MGHGGTLNKIRNIEAMLERATSQMLLKIHPVESIRTSSLPNAVHDDVYNYSLPSDFGELIDLYPQADRTLWDKAFRNPAGEFDRQKATRNKTISLEASEGSKIIRINWRNRKGKVLNAAESVAGNGTWSAVGNTSNIVTDNITKYSGGGSVRFDIPTNGDGIQNTDMAAVDLTDEDGVADSFIAVYLGSDYANLTSVTPVWGNDLTTKYWTGVAQTTQFDGTAFKFGWNIIKVSWSGATETGVVDPAAINSYKLTFATTGVLLDVRIDNIIFSIGRNFDIKYYSKYLLRDATGTWISKTTSDDDQIVVDNDSLPLFLFECLKAMAQQMEGTDSAFDIGFAEKQLAELYPAYRGIYPAMAKKQTSRYTSNPGRGRW